MTTALFADCVIPGCPNPVSTVGEPCGDCRTAFGPMLQQTPGRRLTAEDIAERDQYVHTAYALQRAAGRC